MEARRKAQNAPDKEKLPLSPAKLAYGLIRRNGGVVFALPRLENTLITLYCQSRGTADI
jgi:hypothetical protein